MNTQKIFEIFIGAVLGVVIPASDYVMIALSLIFIDSFFGLLSMEKRGETFDFRKLFFKGIVLKLLLYCVMILALYWVDDILVNNTLIFHGRIVTKLGTLVLLVSEMGSIVKHFKIITGVSVKSNAFTLSNVLNKIRGIIDKMQDK